MKNRKQKKKELSEESLKLSIQRTFLTALHRALYAFIPITTSAETVSDASGL